MNPLVFRVANLIPQTPLGAQIALRRRISLRPSGHLSEEFARALEDELQIVSSRLEVEHATPQLDQALRLPTECDVMELAVSREVLPHLLLRRVLR